MDPSNKDWISPRQSTFGSDGKTKDLIELVPDLMTSKTDCSNNIYHLFTFLNATKPGIFTKIERCESHSSVYVIEGVKTRHTRYVFYSHSGADPENPERGHRM